jgi:hypothetical protein
MPTCYVLPPEMRDLRRLLSYRNMVVQQSVRMQNKMGTPGLRVAISNWLRLDIEGEFTLSRVSGRFSEMPSSPQCQSPPCLLL